MQKLILWGFLMMTGLLAPAANAQSHAATARACGPETKCEINGGYFHSALPAAPKNAPVVIWLHGSSGRAERAVRANGMQRNFTKQGFVFVAPQGRPDPSRPERRGWNVTDGHDQPRDDIAFLTAVIDDVVKRYGTDPSHVLLAGFSRGASMAWDYACANPDKIAAVAATAGGFWEPFKPECAGPVHLFHTHGFKDQMVPLEGRKVSWRGVSFHQGNILKGLDIWREVNGCTGAADSNSVKDNHWEKRWTSCNAGSIRLQITPIGHGIPKGWSLDVIDWFGQIFPTQG